MYLYGRPGSHIIRIPADQITIFPRGVSPAAVILSNYALFLFLMNYVFKTGAKRAQNGRKTGAKPMFLYEH